MKINTTQKTSTQSQKNRFNYLKSMYRQAPLCKSEFDELLTLAKKFNKKMAAELEKESAD